MISRDFRFLTPALLGLLGACASADEESRMPEIVVPATYDARSEEPNAAEIDWRTYFEDEDLEALLAEALVANFDVQIALQRIEIARAGVLEATGALLPQVGIGAGAAIQRFGLYTMDGAGNASTEIRPGELVPLDYAELSLGVSASWEPDLWGRLSNLRDSARAQYLSTIEGTNLVVSALVADVSTTYFELVAADRTLDLLLQTLERQTRALELMRIQKEAGRTTELAVQQFEAEVAGTRALVAESQRQRVDRENQLNLLLGRLPGPVQRSEFALEGRFGVELTAGVPSDLLRNRPDIREAEYLVQASELDLGAARAAFFPSFSISAGAGYEAYRSSLLFSSPDSFVYSLAGSLFLPLLNRRSLEAALQATRASQMQAVLGYQAVVVRAVVEVSTTLVAIERAAEVVEQVERKRAAILASVRSADALFVGGQATYLDVLIAQQSALEAELELIQALLDQRIAGVRLYKVLGGGWRDSLVARH